MKGYDKGILKPPLKLIGAKTKIRRQLYTLFPKHDAYFEPFMGTAGILIGKEPSIYEATSDVNEYAINFYKVLQERPEEFWDRYQWELSRLIMFGKDYFIRLRNSVTVVHENAEVTAVEFYLITKCCMNGIWRLNKKGDCNSSYCGQTNARGFMDREWFDKVRERISKVDFSINDYKWALGQARNAYNKEGLSTFIALDPPYNDCKTVYNGIGWGDKEFIEFKNCLVKDEYRWLLTINDNEFIRNLFKEYEIFPHRVHYSCSQTNAGRGKRPELLIANYPIRDIAIAEGFMENISD